MNKRGQNLIEYVLLVVGVLVAVLAVIQNARFQSQVNDVLQNPVDLVNQHTQNIDLPQVTIPPSTQ